MNNLKSPIKWPGGKRWITPIVKPWIKQHRLVEPFVGGGSVFIGVEPETALLNDINPHVINLYNQIKAGLIVDIEMLNDKEHYLKSRDRFNYLIETNQINTKEAAQLFYYLNKTGFNGLCRFNKAGKLNVAFGQYKTINYAKDFLQYKDNFQNYEFTSKDFSELEIKENDFIYADPPYDATFTKYSSDGFTWEDQERLASWLSKYNNPIVVSNSATDRIIDLYTNLGYEIKFVDVSRRIATNGIRSKAQEIIAYKNLTEN